MDLLIRWNGESLRRLCRQKIAFTRVPTEGHLSLRELLLKFGKHCLRYGIERGDHVAPPLCFAFEADKTIGSIVQQELKILHGRSIGDVPFVILKHDG